MRAILVACVILVVTGCAKGPRIHPPGPTPQCRWVESGAACDPGRMLPESICTCTAEL